MDSPSVHGIYDDGYAADYDQRFLLDAWPKQGAEFEVAVVKDHVPEGGRWLDVGCGTGWFLRQLPHIDRAGLDLSPAMAARARDANPDLEIEVGSFLDDRPEWNGRWDLVTCLWQPYNYVDTVSDVERLLENMAAWTKPGGAVLIPVVDLEDIRPHTVVPYEEEPDVWGGSIALTSITWTWHEPLTGKVHTHLVAPQAGHFVKVLSESFRTVEVLRYPPTERGGVSRKAVLATRRRDDLDDGAPAEVIWHPRPAHRDEIADADADAVLRREEEAARDRAERDALEVRAAADAAAAENQSRWRENEIAWRENEIAWSENDAAWATHHQLAQDEIERANRAEAEAQRLWAEVARLSEVAATGDTARPSRHQLSRVPTKDLARAIGGRIRPDRVARRLLRRRG